VWAIYGDDEGGIVGEARRWEERGDWSRLVIDGISMRDMCRLAINIVIEL